MKTLQKMTVLVLDSTPVHKARLLTSIPEWQEKHLFIFFLPPYSPLLNKIEHLWCKMKYEWLKPESYTYIENLEKAIHDRFHNSGDQYAIQFNDHLKLLMRIKSRKGSIVKSVNLGECYNYNLSNSITISASAMIGRVVCLING